MNHRNAVAMLKASRRAWASNSRFETYVALVLSVAAVTVLYREYRVLRGTFKSEG